MWAKADIIILGLHVCEKRRTRCGRIQEMPGLSFQEKRQVSRGQEVWFYCEY